MTDSMLRVEYAGIQVSWRPHLDGGGRAFGQDFLPLVRELIGPVDRLLEACAGPGFIGFSMLAHGLCESLVLADVNPDAVTVAQDTVCRNGLEGRVRVYRSDGLDGLPADERFDLVVANPPHFAESPADTPSRITDDPGWRLHRRFYRDIGRFLAPGASVLMQENSEGGNPEDFRPMIYEAQLDLVRTLWYVGGTAGPSFYYLWLKNRIPGLLTYDGAPVTPVVLAEPATAQIVVDGPGPHALRLFNRARRPVRVRVVDDAKLDQLWVPLKEVGVGGSLDLPPMALRPGGYALVEAASDTVLARLSVTN